VTVLAVTPNNRKKSFLVETDRGTFEFPFARCDAAPSADDPIAELFIDDELGRDGFTFVLASGVEDSVIDDQIWDYNEEPRYMRDVLLYKLSLEAQDALAASRLSRREIIRRLGTSPAQFYRLIDQTNYSKSIDGMLALLQVLDREVDVVVRPRGSADRRRTDSRGNAKAGQKAG
jgi:hypothetical protein